MKEKKYYVSVKNTSNSYVKIEVPELLHAYILKLESAVSNESDRIHLKNEYPRLNANLLYFSDGKNTFLLKRSGDNLYTIYDTFNRIAICMDTKSCVDIDPIEVIGIFLGRKLIMNSKEILFDFTKIDISIDDLYEFLTF